MSDILLEKMQQYVDEVSLSLTSLDERMSSLTGEHVLPNVQADEAVAMTEELTYALVQKQIEVGIYDAFMEGLLMNPEPWKAGDPVPVYNAPNIPVLDVDTRLGPCTIHFDSAPDMSGNGHIWFIRDAFGTFKENPCTIILGPKKAGAVIDGTWDLFGPGDEGTLARYTLEKNDLITAVSVGDFYIPTEIGTPRAAVIEGVGNPGMDYENKYISSLAGINGRAIKHPDGDLTIYGRSKADGIFTNWPTDIGNRELSSFIVSSGGIDNVTNIIDPTTRSGKNRWTVTTDFDLPYVNTEPYSADRMTINLQNDYKIEVDARKVSALGDMSYVGMNVYNTNGTRVHSTPFITIPGTPGANLPNTSATGDRIKIIGVYPTIINDPSYPGAVYKFKIVIFCEVEDTDTGRTDINLIHGELEIEHVSVPASSYSWVITDPAQSLITLRSDDLSAIKPYITNTLQSDAGVEFSIVDNSGADPVIDSWVYNFSTGTFFQSAGAYGSITVTGLAGEISQSSLASWHAGYNHYFVHETSHAALVINDNGTLKYLRRRYTTTASEDTAVEHGIDATLFDINTGLELTSILKDGAKSPGVLEIDTGFVSYHYLNGVKATISLADIYDADVIHGNLNDYLFILTRDTLSNERLFIYMLPDYNPGAAGDITPLLLDRLIVPKDSALQKPSLLNGTEGNNGNIFGPDLSDTLVGQNIIVESDSREFNYRAHFSRKIGDTDGIAI